MKNHPRPILVGPLIFRIAFYLSRHSIFYPTRILMHERSRSKMQKNRGSYAGAVPFALVTACSSLVLVAPASTTIFGGSQYLVSVDFLSQVIFLCPSGDGIMS